MGQSNRITKRTLEKSPFCIFCGGGTPATTLDHVPARAQFWGRRRPHGLEVPACKPCNHGTSSLEQAASVFARIRATDLTELEQDEFRRVAQNVERSFPGWRKELTLTPSQQQAFNRRFGHARGVVSAANMEGPLAMQSLNAVGAKIGFALHYAKSGRIVPNGGVVHVKFETNATIKDRPLPTELLSALGPLEHLKQGIWTSEGHFGFRGGWTPGGEGGVYIGHLGLAILYIVIVFADATQSPMSKGFADFKPGELQRADEQVKARYLAPLAFTKAGGPAGGGFGFWRPGIRLPTNQDG